MTGGIEAAVAAPRGPPVEARLIDIQAWLCGKVTDAVMIRHSSHGFC